MAKNNKYASINFNHIYENTINTNTNHRSPCASSSAPKKPHGRILVLTRPTPKPVAPPTPQQHPPNPISHTPVEPGSDAISLRPLGRTGTASSLSPLPVPVPVPNLDKHLLSPQPKTNKFVPPHLRPGFVPREEAPPPGPDSLRPKSGGGPRERMRRAGRSDAGIMGRGTRPNSSG